MLGLPVIETWAQWGRTFTDPALWRPAIEAIARRTALPVDSVSPGFPGTNAVFLVNGDSSTAAPYIVKIYAPFCRDDFYIERDVLRALTAHPEIGAPPLLADGVLKDQQAWPYLVLGVLPGVAIREVWGELSATARDDLARALGERVGHLHAVPPEVVPALSQGARRWSDIARSYLHATCSELARDGVVTPTVAAAVEAQTDRLLPDWLSEPHLLVHGDLTEDHILLSGERQGWCISGLIDFADCTLAPRAYEWIALWHGALAHDRPALVAFFAGYQAITGQACAVSPEGIAQWTLCHAFGSAIVQELWRSVGQPPLDSPAALLRLLTGST